MFPTSAKWWPVPLRLILGIGFLYHGLPKVGSTEGHQMFLGMLQNIGVPASSLMAWVVGIVEVLGGLAILAGAFVAVAAIPLIVDMLIAMFTVHWPSGFSFMNITGMNANGPVFGMPGYEISLLYIACLLAVAIGGAGAWSVDERRRTGAAERVATG